MHQSAFVENGKRESNKEKDQDEDEKSSWTFWFVLLGIAAAILGMYYAPTQVCNNGCIFLFVVLLFCGKWYWKGKSEDNAIFKQYCTFDDMQTR